MGFIIAFSGVDGSGKTTIAKRLVSRLQSQGLKVTYHHELDFILLKPIFRLATRLTGKRAENASNIGNSGNVIKNSVKRWMTSSNLPPKYPEIAPMRAPNVSEKNVTTKATVNEIRPA